MRKSKWSYLNEEIIELFENNTNLGYKTAARQLLGSNADRKDLDLLRTYIKRLLKKEEHSTVNKTLKEHNLDNKDWSVAWIKEKGISLMVKNPDNSASVSLERIREDFKREMNSYSPKYNKIDYRPLKDPHCLVIDIADLHIGKLASSLETGNEYNVKIAEQRAREGVGGILSKASGFEIEEIVFIIGNDILHTDTPKRTTTSGTLQDTDGMWYDNFLIARRLYCSIIESLALLAPVAVIHNPSNHDFMSGFMLADSVSCWFRNHNSVSFDVGMKHRKYHKYGLNMIGSTHGDGAKMDKLPYLAAHEEPTMWAETKYRYMYCHHIHHKQNWKFQSGADFIGMEVDYLRSPSGTDSWHHRQGYTGNIKAVEGAIHHKTKGKIAKLTHIVD